MNGQNRKAADNSTFVHCFTDIFVVKIKPENVSGYFTDRHNNNI